MILVWFEEKAMSLGCLISKLGQLRRICILLATTAATTNTLSLIADQLFVIYLRDKDDDNDDDDDDDDDDTGTYDRTIQESG